MYEGNDQYADRALEEAGWHSAITNPQSCSAPSEESVPDSPGSLTTVQMILKQSTKESNPIEQLTNSHVESPDGTSAITTISLARVEGNPSGNVVRRSRAVAVVRPDAGLDQLWEATDRHVFEIEEQLSTMVLPAMSERRPGSPRSDTSDLGGIDANGLRLTQPEVHFNHPQPERRERIAQLSRVAVEMFLESRG
jgi:hypothetical protein